MKAVLFTCVAVALLACSFARSQTRNSSTTIDLEHPLVQPGEVVSITGDRLKLSTTRPAAWIGSPLPSLLTGHLENGIGRITEPGALLPKSLILRMGDKVLVEGKDYLLDPNWGTLGIAPGSSLKPDDTVTADYQYAKLRLDSVVKQPDGTLKIISGTSALTNPHIPEIRAIETRVENIFVPYNSNGKDVVVLPILEPASAAVTGTTPKRIPLTLTKLTAGKAVKIVCWGDSITAGGDASRPETRYPALFQQRLREKFPQSTIDVKAIAAGGSTSRQWLYPDKFPYGGPLSWEMVASEHPDLVTIEFANDNYIDALETLPTIYQDIEARLHAMGAEVIFITPSYFDLEYMKFSSFKDPDRRPFTLFLRELTTERHQAVADAAARWGHLWKEGIPYTTYLENGINHPDDRGHVFFAEELMKCFE